MKTTTDILQATTADLNTSAIDAGDNLSAPSAIDLIDFVRDLEKLEDDQGRGVPYKARTISVAPGQKV